MNKTVSHSSSGTFSRVIHKHHSGLGERKGFFFFFSEAKTERGVVRMRSSTMQAVNILGAATHEEETISGALP